MEISQNFVAFLEYMNFNQHENIPYSIKKFQPEVGQIPIGRGKFWILEHHLLRKGVGSREQKVWGEKLIWEKKEATQCDEEATSLAMPEISIGETKKTYYNHKIFTVPKTKSVWRLVGVNSTIS